MLRALQPHGLTCSLFFSNFSFLMHRKSSGTFSLEQSCKTNDLEVHSRQTSRSCGPLKCIDLAVSKEVCTHFWIYFSMKLPIQLEVGSCYASWFVCTVPTPMCRFLAILAIPSSLRSISRYEFKQLLPTYFGSLVRFLWPDSCRSFREQVSPNFLMM